MVFRIIFFLTLILSCSFFSFAQNTPPVLKFEGYVSDEKDELRDANLQITQNGKVINNVQSDSEGNYAFELPLGGDFLVTVSKEGYISKRFSVNTQNVPPERAAKKLPVIEASLVLFKKVEGVDYSLFNQPMNKFGYLPEEGGFGYDTQYLKQMQKAVESVKAAEKQILDKEKAKEASYNAAVKSGDKLFSSKDWNNALAKYKEAADIKPNEVYPKSRIEIINKTLADNEAKKQADEEAAKAKAEAEKSAKEKAAADLAAKQKSEQEAKAKAEAERLAKEKADKEAKEKAAAELAAKQKSEQEAKAKSEAERLAKEKADKEAKEKVAADLAAKQKIEQEAKAKAEAERLAKEKELADAKAKAEAERIDKERAEAEKLAKQKVDAELAARKKAEEQAAKATAGLAAKKKAEEEARAKALQEAEANAKLAAKEKAKQDSVAKALALAKENESLDERQKQLLDKYPQGVTEEILPGDGMVVIKRVLVKEKRVYVYEKKIFNWGGVSCFRDGTPITDLVFETETKKN